MVLLKPQIFNTIFERLN